MLYGGCDLGVVSAKVAIIDDGDLLAWEILPYSSFPREAAVAALDNALSRTGLAGRKMDRFVSTGFGAKAVAHSDGIAPDTGCLQRALRKLNPNVRTVINIGGHSFTAFYVDAEGGVGEIAITDFCTAGMGMLLENISAALEVPLDVPLPEAGSPGGSLNIDLQCPIFAESEAISLLNDGYEGLDVFAAIVSAVANKIAGQIRRLGVVSEIAMVGGVSKNRPVVARLEKNLNLKFADLGGTDPQVVAAYGAALLAREGCRLDSASLSTTAAERIHRKAND